MARTIAATIQDTTPRENLQPGFQFENLQVGVGEVDDVTGGMVTTTARGQAPKNSFLVVRNGRTRFGWVGRRPGTNEFIPKPDSHPVLGLILFVTDEGSPYLIRITSASAHVAKTPAAWQQLSYPFSGRLFKIRSARYLGDVYFTSGGFNRIARINLAGMEIKEIPESPIAKHVTAFADRIIAANIRDQTGYHPYQIAWSVNANPLDWKGLGSGVENLVQSPGDFGDEITGIFGLTSGMVILRKNSIWIATRQPFAEAPFRFTPVFDGYGCDLPYTAVQAEDSIIYADLKSRGVFVYEIGGRPRRISAAVEDVLFQDLKNFEWAEGAYDPFNQEYHLGLTTAEGSTLITKTWVFSLKNGAISFDDGPVVSTIGIVSAPPTGLTIGQLQGTIGGLQGTFEDFGGESTTGPEVFKGLSTGEVIIQSYAHDTDHGGAPFEFEVVSQDIGSPSRRRTIKDLVLRVEASRVGQASLAESLDQASWINVETFGINVGSQNIGIKRRSITGEEIYWRLVASASDVRIKSWYIRILEKGIQR